MKHTFKDKTYALLIMFCFFLISVGLPFERWLSTDWANIAKAVIKILFFLISIFIIKKYEIASSYGRVKGNKWIFTLPFFLIATSNMYFLLINGGASLSGTEHLWSQALLCLATALAEEIFFRVAIIEVFKEKIDKEWALILISAGTFSISHAANFFTGTAALTVLSQIGYTFVLGLLLGLIYTRGGKMVLSSLLHFLFNFVNASLFECLYHGDWNVTFYIVNGAIGALMVGYCLFLILKEKGPYRPISEED